MKDRLQFPHYWICDACAKERGGSWPEGHIATFVDKQCKYCKGDKQTDRFIAPWVDYNWLGRDTRGLRD